MTEVPQLIQEYLGDGVYASYQGWDIQISTPRKDGDHTVYLEVHVLKALIDFAKRVGMLE